MWEWRSVSGVWTLMGSDVGAQYFAGYMTEKALSVDNLFVFLIISPAGDNAAMESFYSLLQKNDLDRPRWITRAELAYAILVWIPYTYNRRRRQRSLGKLTRRVRAGITVVAQKHRNRRVHGDVRGSLPLSLLPESRERTLSAP
jgi:hypothetical protein